MTERGSVESGASDRIAEMVPSDLEDGPHDRASCGNADSTDSRAYFETMMRTTITEPDQHAKRSPTLSTSHSP